MLLECYSNENRKKNPEKMDSNTYNTLDSATRKLYTSMLNKTHAERQLFICDILSKTISMSTCASPDFLLYTLASGVKLSQRLQVTDPCVSYGYSENDVDDEDTDNDADDPPPHELRGKLNENAMLFLESQKQERSLSLDNRQHVHVTRDGVNHADSVLFRFYVKKLFHLD